MKYTNTGINPRCFIFPDNIPSIPFGGHQLLHGICGSVLSQFLLVIYPNVDSVKSVISQKMVQKSIAGWWSGTVFIFPYIGNNNPNWLIFFRGVETTNQIVFGWIFLWPHCVLSLEWCFICRGISPIIPKWFWWFMLSSGLSLIIFQPDPIL